MMTPYQIEFLIYICTRPWDSVMHHFIDSDVRKETIELFVKYRLLDRSGFPAATDKAQAYLKAMCDMPMPVCVWKVPVSGPVANWEVPTEV